MRGDPVRRPRVDRQRSASRTAVDRAATKPGQGNGTTSTWAAGPARNPRKVVTWLRLCAMSPSAKRQCKGLRVSEGTGPAPDRGAAAAPECNLRRRAFSAGAAPAWPNIKSGMGARQHRRSLVGQPRRRNPAGGLPTRHHARVRSWLRMQRLPGAPAGQDDKEPLSITSVQCQTGRQRSTSDLIAHLVKPINRV